MNLLELFKQSLLLQKKPASPITVKNYLSDVRHFISWLEEQFTSDFDPKLITSETLDLYNNAHRNIFSSSSLERHLSSLRKFFVFLTEKNIIDKNPFTKPVIAKPTDLWKIKEFKDLLYRENASAHTIKNYIKDIEGIRNWHAQTLGVDIKDTPNTITLQLIQEYKTRLLYIAKLSPKTINRKLSAIRRYVEFTQNIINPQSIAIQNIAIKPAILEKEQAMPNSLESSPTAPVKKRSFFNFLNPSFIEDLIAHKIAQGIKSLQGKNNSKTNILSNIKKEFYAPDSLSIRSFPLHKKLYHHMRYTRPEWYKKYHNQSFAHYLNASLLIIYSAIIGLMLYQNLFEDKRPSFAAPNQTLKVYSFQGRLTDTSDEPITTSKLVRFILYTSPTASDSARLWEEVRTISPDSDGIFSILLGSNSTGGNASLCNGSSPSATPATSECGIPDNLFRDNSQVFLGISIEQDSELTPRQQIATVAYSTNSLFLQGLPPITQSDAGTTNVVLALDSSGDLTIGGSASPTFQATGGQFTFSGDILTLLSNTDSGGDIQLIPDGMGKIDLQKPIVNTGIVGNLSPGGVEINDKFGILATESAVAAFVVNNNTTGGDIFTASSSGTTQFTIANDGTATIDGSVLPSTTSSVDLGSSALRWNNLYVNTISTTSISQSGQAVFTYDPATTAFSESTVFINPTTASTSDTLLGIGIAGVEKAGIDAEGDLVLGYSSSTAPLVDNPFNVYNHGTSLVASIDTSGNASFSGTLKLSTSPIIQSTANQTLTLGGDTTGNILLQPLNGSGYVGIGTTGPDRKLDILDASNPQLRLTQADGTIYADFQMTSGGDLVMNVDGVSNQLVLDNGGSVGIGTNTPDALLTLSATSPDLKLITSGDGNHGRLNRTTTQLTQYNEVYKPGANYSLNFTSASSQSVNITVASGALRATTAVTVSVWAKRTSGSGQADIVSFQDYSGANGYRLWFSNGTTVCFGVAGTGGAGFKCASTTIAQGSWHHIVAVYNGSTIQLYTDGATNGTAGAVTTTSMTYSQNNFRIGGFAAADLYFFDGNIDDPRVYARELSSSEVSTLYSGSDPSSTSLAAEWKFNEGTGSSAADASGNGYTASLTNSPSWDTDVAAANPAPTAGSYTEVPVFIAADGSAANQEGIQTFGWTNGATILRGDYLKFAYGASDTEAMRISSSGKVGIGTTTPAYKFDIATSTASDRGINIAHTATTGTNYGVYSSVTGAATTNYGGYFVSTGATTDYGLAVAAMTGATSTGLDIGALSGATNNKGINIGNITGTPTGSNYGINIGTIATATTNSYGIYIGGPAAASTNYAIYSNAAAQSYFAGNVGIGTASPQELLNVNGEVSIGAAQAGQANVNLHVFGDNAKAGSSETVAFFGSSDAAASNPLGVAVGHGGSDDYGYIQGTTIGLAAKNLILQKDGGNVGVGTTSPGGLGAGGSPVILHVNDSGATANDFALLNLSSANVGSGGTVGSLEFGTTGASSSEKRSAMIVSVLSAASGTNVSGNLSFYTNNAGSITEKLQITAAGQVQAPITGSSAGLLIGGDTQLYRGNTNEMYLASGDSLRIVSGALTFDSGLIDVTYTNGLAAFKTKITGDTDSRFYIESGGTMYWGAGVSGLDTNLYRSAADTLRTGDAFVADGTLSVAGGYGSSGFSVGATGNVSGDGTFTIGNATDGSRITAGGSTAAGIWVRYTDNNMYIDSDSNINFRTNGASALATAATLSTGGQFQLPTTGSSAGVLIGGDFQIYRLAADFGYTPDTFQVGGAFQADTTAYFPSTGGAGANLIIGGDTNLYRGAANRLDLASGDSFRIVAGQLQLDTADGGTSATGIVFGSTGDTNLYRSAADTLKTDDAFTATGSINSESTTAPYQISGSTVLHNTGTRNIFLGISSGNTTLTSTDTTALGYQAGTALTTGIDNVFVGTETGKANTSGGHNTFLGFEAGFSNTTASFNTFLGDSAGYANTTGANNLFVGVQAGSANTTGTLNAFFGNSSGLFNTTGGSNTFIGESSGFSNTTASNNTFIGNQAGYSNTTATGNVFVGYLAGDTATPANANVTGANNTFIGYGSGPGSTTQLTNATAIGYQALVTASNSLVLGSGVNVGIGITAPTTVLSALGTISSADGAIGTITNNNTTDSANTVTLRLNTGATATTTNARFVTFYAGVTSGDTGGTGVGRIQLNNNNVAYNTGAADFGERFPVAEPTEPGDIIGQIGEVNKKATHANGIIGVVSDTTGFTGNDTEGVDEASNPIVGLLGQVRTKVSTENGPIEVGDHITTSSIPGVGMKATKAGRIVGSALEPYHESGIGKTKVFINPGWYDPDVYITSTGDLSIQLLASEIVPQYKVSDSLNETITRMGAFAELVVGNFRAGVINAQQVTTNSLQLTTNNITIAGQSIQEFILATVRDAGFLPMNETIVSPLASIDQINTNIISPLGSETIAVTGNIEVKNSQNETVAQIDTTGSATFSGTLNSQQLTTNKVSSEQLEVSSASISGTLAAEDIQTSTLTTTDATISGTLRAGRILADDIEGLNARIATLAANTITNYGTASAELINTIPQAQLDLGFVDISTFSASFGTFREGLIALGPSTFSQITAIDSLSVGTNLAITTNSINLLGEDLQIQPLRQGGISFLAGLVRIDTNGNLTVGGNADFAKNVTVHGTLAANIISPLPNQDVTVSLENNGATSNFKIQGASNSAVLAIDSTGDLVSSGSGTFNKLKLSFAEPAYALDNTTSVATGSAGTAILKSTKKEITINNPLVTEKSLIYVTPVGSATNQVLYLLRQVAESETANGSFTVGIAAPTLQDIQFNWIIVN